PVRVVEQRAVDELPHRGCDALGQGFRQRLPGGSRQPQGVPHASPRPNLFAMIAAISSPVVSSPVPYSASAIADIASGSDRTANVSVRLSRSSTAIRTPPG